MPNKKKNAKKPFAILVDSSIGYEKELMEKYPNLFIMPINLVVNMREMPDIPEIVNYEFMVKLFNDGIIPKTSAWNTTSFCNLVDDLLTKYETLYVLPLGKKYSGTYNIVKTITQMTKYSKKLFVFDANSIFLGTVSIIDALYSNFEKKENPDKIQELIYQISDNNYYYFVPRDISVIKESGRLNIAEELFINFLKLKIVFKYGEDIEVLAKVRTTLQAKKIIIDDINETLKEYPNSKIHFPIAEEQLDTYYIEELIPQINTKNICFRKTYSNIALCHIGIVLVLIYIEKVK